MNNLIEYVNKSRGRRLAILCIAAAAIIAAIAGSVLAFSRPPMEVLYSDLQENDAAAVLAALDGGETPVRLSGDGRTVYAPRDQIDALRMKLAADGLPKGGGIGYEIFDQKNSLGLTSFMQDISRLRALEGELARTIQTLDDIESARVHLVLASRDPFSRETAPPTASVVVRLRGALTLDSRHAAAIRHLVASGVPHLSPSAVSVLDARGGSVFAEETGAIAGASRVDGLRREMEARLATSVESVLTPHLGPGAVRVRVAADLSAEREVRREERFDPRDSAIRSRQVVDESEQSTDNANEDPVTVQQNLPEGAVNGGAAGQAKSQNERSEQVLNFEVSSVKREQVIEPGQVQRLSVAVVVDHVRETGPNGEPIVRERTPDEMRRIENLVKSAVGFNANRGDVVTVESLPFMDLDTLMPPVKGETVWQFVSHNLGAIVGGVVLLTLGLVFILAIGRPLLDRALPPVPALRSADSGPVELLIQDGDYVDKQGVEVLEDGSIVERLALPKRSMNETLDEMLQLRDVDGKVRASSIRKIGQMVDQYPDEVVAILRSWIYEDAA